MKITRANVEKYAREQGYHPIEIDGIPEGFAWQSDDITINNKTYKGKIIKFKPLEDWEKGISYE